MHIDFDDITWKNAVQSYLSSQKTGYTVPFNNIESQAMISSSPFYKTCYNESSPKSSLIVSKLTSSTTTIATIAQAVKSINTSYAQIPQIEDKIADLACYSQSCINSICSMSCLNKVQAVCEKLTLEYIKSNPTSNASSTFNCPVSADSINNKPICYDLTNAKRDAIGNNLNKVMTDFQLKAITVRKGIVEELWLIHKQKQEKTNTSASIADCNQVANTKWTEFFKPYIQGQ
jgi:hypothetical protein